MFIRALFLKLFFLNNVEVLLLSSFVLKSYVKVKEGDQMISRFFVLSIQVLGILKIVYPKIYQRGRFLDIYMLASFLLK